MTAAELRALILEKSPAELTPEECAALRAAIRTSPELLRELAEQIQIDAHLTQALGRTPVSVERVLERLARRRSHAVGVWTRYGLVVCALVAAVLGAVVASRGWRGRGRPVEVAEQPVGPPPVAVAPTPAGTPAVGPSPPQPEPSTSVSQPPVEPASPGSPSAAPAAVAAQPHEPLREAGLFEPAAAEDATSDDKSLGRWLAAVDKLPLKLSTQPLEGKPCGRFDGLARLRRPLVEGAALRLSSSDFDGLRIHVWSGARGVTFDAFRPPRAWLAFATTRSGDGPLPAGYVTVARDDGRMIRTNPTGVHRIELRYADGMVTLARGDVRLVEAPLAGPPTDVFFEGAATFRDVAVVAAAPLPSLRAAPARPASDLLVANKEAWVRGGDPGAGFTVHDDGMATLTAVSTTQPAWAVLPLAGATGLRELVVRLEGVAPGAGLVLADAKGTPQSVLRVLSNKNVAGVLQLDRRLPADPARESIEAVTMRPITFVPGTVWIRLRQCGGVQLFDVSGDGRSWVLGAEAQPAFAAVGLHLVPQAAAQSITVTALEEAEFPRLQSLAPAAVRDVAVELPSQGPLPAWLAAADAAKPPALEVAEWRRACALKAVAGGVLKPLAIDLLGLLWQEGLAVDMPPDARQDLLDEILALAPVADDPAAAGPILGLVASRGAQLVAAGEPGCFSAISQELATVPLRCGEPFVAFPEPLARREIIGCLANGDFAAVQRLVERLAFFGFTSKPRNDVFFRWAGTVATGRLAAKPAPLAPEWRHPLLAAPGKESLSVQAELSGAMAAEDWQDVCRLIDAAAADGAIDLLPDRKDPDLLVSLPVAVATAMRDEPRLQETMRQEREQIAGLRLLEATAAGSVAAVEAAAVQFHGTVAAAEAHLWLGDRSLAAGRFTAARRHYELAAGMLPPTAERQVNRAAAAIELARRLGGSGAAVMSSEGSAVPAASADLVATPLARLEGDVGSSAATLPPPLATGGIDWPPHAIDWVARQLAVLPLADRVLVSNRFQLASHDPATGVVQWRAGVGTDAGAAHDWHGQPMRPVADAERAYVRRLRKSGPAVAGISLADGAVAWELPSTAERQFVSDPLLADEGTLVICTGRKVDDAHAVAVVTLDAVTGRVIREAPLVTLGSAWWTIRDCQLVAADGTWIVVAGGSVIACDADGRLLWARREPWLPPAVDGFWMLAAQGPTLVRDGRVHVVQPGVPGVVTLDAASGRVLWRQADPSVSRIRGVAQGRLIVERIGMLVSAPPTPAGEKGDLVALDVAHGARIWRFGPADLLDASLATDDGLLVAVREPFAGKSARGATLVRLDPATGRELRRWPLVACADPQPFLGPCVPSSGRLWIFFGRGPADATRDVMALAAP